MIMALFLHVATPVDEPKCKIESAAEIRNFTSELVGRGPNEVYIHKLVHAAELPKGIRQQSWSTFCFEWHTNLTFPSEVPCWACRSQDDLNSRTALFDAIALLAALFVSVMVACEFAQRWRVWRGARTKLNIKHTT